MTDNTKITSEMWQKMKREEHKKSILIELIKMVVEEEKFTCCPNCEVYGGQLVNRLILDGELVDAECYDYVDKTHKRITCWLFDTDNLKTILKSIL